MGWGMGGVWLIGWGGGAIAVRSDEKKKDFHSGLD
jgi:hypothetical protein